jgi:predicted molibdopterin-dependent oxidoreductase YjgC
MLEMNHLDNDIINTKGFKEMAQAVESFTPEKVTDSTGIRKEIYDQLLAWLLPLNRKVVFIYNTDASREKSPHDLEAIGNLLMLNGRLCPHSSEKRGGILLMGEYANSAGMMEMGALPDYLPGFVKPNETKEIQRISSEWNLNLEPIFNNSSLSHKDAYSPHSYAALKEKFLQGHIKALLVFGEDPLAHAQLRKYFAGLEFLMVQDLYHTATTDEADVVIPAASFMEQTGTYTSCWRTIQTAHRFLTPPGGKENIEFIQALANRFHMNMNYTAATDIQNEIKKVNRFHSGLEITNNPQFKVHPSETSITAPEAPVPLYSENYFNTARMHLKLRN